MKLIPLTRGYFTQVDDEDFEELSKYKWQVGIVKKDRVQESAKTMRHNRQNGSYAPPTNETSPPTHSC